MKIIFVQTWLRSPWQNGIAERWIGSCRELPTTLSPNERHLEATLSDYVRYYHEDRTHLGLDKGTPNYRPCSASVGSVISCPRLGGLHHRYDRAA